MSTKSKFTSRVYRERTGAKASKELTDLRKAQLGVSAKVTAALKSGPKTIPQIAQASGITAKTILWYLMTYYKYDLVATTGKTEDGYFLYALKTKGG